MTDGTTLAIAVAFGLVTLSTIAGFFLKRRQGRVRESVGLNIGKELTVEGKPLTLVQLSSEVCAYCPAMRRVNEQLAADDEELGFRELDIMEYPELVRKLNILSTPVTLVVSNSGTVISRAVGVTTAAKMREALQNFSI